MNYLAHAYLSGTDPGVMTGNFIADHVRNNGLSRYKGPLLEGILLHRKIDAFTDAHHAFRSAKRHFYGGFEKYSGILVDIYFDHFLASGFAGLTGLSLPAFARNAYDAYNLYKKEIPDSAQRFLHYAENNNVYVAYADLPGISTVLSHLSHRIGHDVGLDKSVPAFIASKDELFDLFHVLMRDARATFLSDVH